MVVQGSSIGAQNAQMKEEGWTKSQKQVLSLDKYPLMVVRPGSRISHKTIEAVRYRQALSGNEEKISLCAEIAVRSNSLVGLCMVCGFEGR